MKCVRCGENRYDDLHMLYDMSPSRFIRRVGKDKYIKFIHIHFPSVSNKEIFEMIKCLIDGEYDFREMSKRR